MAFGDALKSRFGAFVAPGGGFGDLLRDYGRGLMTGRNLGEGLALGANYGAEMQPYRDERERMRKSEAEKVAQSNATLEWLKGKAATDPRYADLIAGVESGAMSLGDAWTTGLSLGAEPEPVKGIEINGRLVNPFTGDEMGNYSDPSSGTPDISMQPQWGIGPDGKPVLGQLSSDGRFVPTQFPEGVETMDPRTLSSERAAGTAFGRGQGNAVFDLPQAEWTADTTIKEIDAILANKDGLDQLFGNTLGIPNVMTPTWPNTPKADIEAQLAQAQGRTFLQAYEMLRGGGQITEVEGRKAEDAMARLGRAQTRDAFETALRDLKAAVAAGLQKLRQQATMPVTPANGANYVYDPATGDLVPQ